MVGKFIKRTILIIAAIFSVAVIIVNFKFQILPIHFTKGGESNLTILTWNIHDSDPDYKQHQKGIAEEILKQNADIVFLCEYYDQISGELDAILRKTYPFVDKTWANVMAGNKLYSRYPILRSYQPVGNVFTYYVQVNDTILRVVGCHLTSTNNQSPDHRYTFEKRSDLQTLPTYFKNYIKAQKIRTREAAAVAGHIQSEPMPTIVLGDMNDFSGSPVLDTLQSADLKNAWWEGGTGFGVTFREGWMYFRLDHILYDSNYELSSIDVVRSDLSDHMALVGKFILK